MDTNLILPFQLESSGLRGRIARFDTMLNDILSAHNYPPVIAHMLAETLVLCALLSTMLKYDGIFTLQIQTQGIVPLVVADMQNDATIRMGMRGCARFQQDHPDIAKTHPKDYMTLWGDGYIAFTVDQGEYAEKYQGIVALKGDNLTQAIQHYFNQSEQIGTGLRLAVQQDAQGKWHGAGIMMQHMPEENQNFASGSNLVEDHWRRAMIFTQSCTDEELLDPNLSPEDLLYRLYHEEGVRVFKASPLHKACRCSRKKVEDAFRLLSDDDIDAMFENDPTTTASCEFCSTDYVFSRADIDTVRG